MKAFAIDDLVLSEEGRGGDNVSALQQVTGLAGSTAQMARRHGRRPVVAGLEQAARRIFLETWLHGDYQDANVRLLLQYLDTNRRISRRLTAVDVVPPVRFGTDDVLLAMGPWDVYCNDDGNWRIRDLLRPDDVEAAISGAVHFVSGARASATERAAETVNYVTNPVAGGSSGYANYNGGVLDRSTDRYLYDSCTGQSYVLTLDNNGEGGRWTIETLTAGLYYVSFWLWSEDVDGDVLQASLNSGGTWSDVELLATSGEWSRYGVAISIGAGTSNLYLRINAPIAVEYPDPEWTTTPGEEWTTTPGEEWTYWVAGVTLYLDGVQVEDGIVVSALKWGGMDDYDWSGTAHNSATELPQAVVAGTGYGDETRAILNERATTNQVLNPVAGALGNFTGIGSYGAVARSSEVYLFDSQNRYSFEVSVVVSGDGGSWTLDTLSNDDHAVSFWQYGQSPNTLQVSLDNTNWHDVSELMTEGDWTRYSAQVPAAQANGSTTLYIRQNAGGTGSFNLDGVQVEEEAEYWPTTVCWGDAGPGYSWSGTEHASSSSRLETEIEIISGSIPTIDEYEELSVEIVLQFPYSYDSDEWPDTQMRILEFIDLLVYMDQTGGTINVTEPGGIIALISVDANELAWAAGDWIHLVLTMDENEVRLYWNGTIIGCISDDWLPVTSDNYCYVGSPAVQANIAVAQFRVYGRALTCSEVNLCYSNNVWRARWVDVQVEQVQPRVESGRVLPNAYVSTLALDGDVRWRNRDGDVAFWRVHNAAEALRVTIEGDDEVYPEFRITPVAAKTSGFHYKRWCPIIWRSEYGDVNRPTAIEPPNLGGYVQESGNDVRVYVNDVEVDRWLLGDIPDAMQIWVNLDFQGQVEMTLDGAMGSTEDVEQITVEGDISTMPTAGILLIGEEAFTYSNKQTSTCTFMGIVRAVRDTSQAEHADGATVHWIQHDIMLYYGDDSLGAPDVDNDHAPTFVYQPRESGDDQNLLGGWDGVTGITSSNTDGGVLYVIVVYDGSSTYHVELYKDAGCASGDLVGHTAGYTSTGSQAVVADNGSGLGGTILIESVEGHTIVETGDSEDQLSGWENITGVTPANTDSGILYAEIIYDGAGYCHVDLYKDAAKESGDLVGHTATYNSTGAKAITADNGSGLGGTITVDAVGDYVETGDSKGRLSGWENITGITSGNTDDYVLYATVARDGGGYFHVDLYMDAAKGAGDLVGHTATYNSTGAKAIVADNGSGLGGTITVSSVGSITESGDTNSQLSGWDNITGLDEDNTDNGMLYTAIVRDGSGYYHLEFFSDDGHTQLVGHTATYNSTGAKAVVADNGSGLGGTITVDSLTMPTPWDSGDDAGILSGWDGMTGITYAVCGQGVYGGYIRAQADGIGSPYNVKLMKPWGTSWQMIAHTADYSSTGAKALIEDNDSGVGGTVTVDALGNTLCTVWMNFAVEVEYGLVGGIQVQFSCGTVLATFDFDIEVEWSLVSGDSSNYQWVFERFGENDGLRSAAWQCSVAVKDGDNLGRYTGDYGDGEQYADPWEEIGLDLAPTWKHFWSFYSPCEITNANFESGEYKASHANRQARIDSSKNGVLWREEYDVAPNGADTWTAWSQDVALTTGSRYVRMYGQALLLECDKVTLTFNPARVPFVLVGAQQDNYALECTITNETTEEAITLAVNIEVNTTLSVNVDTGVVRLLDGTKLQHALTEDSARSHSLRLTPGVNDLAFSETGADELEIDVLWDRRHFK